MATTDIVARLRLKADEFNAEKARVLGSFEASANAVSKKVSGVMAGIGAAGLAGLVVAGKNAFDYASGLAEMSQQLGVSTRDLQLFRSVASQTGIQEVEMDKSLAALTLTLGRAATGGKAQSAAFKTLGIEIHNANGSVKSAGEVMPLLADAYTKAGGSAQGAAAAAELLGAKVGGKMVPMLALGSKGINQMTAEAERMGMVISDKAIAAADEAADSFSKLNEQFRAKLATTIGENAGAIIKFSEALIYMVGNTGKAITAWQVLRQEMKASNAEDNARLPAWLTGNNYRLKQLQDAADARGEIARLMNGGQSEGEGRKALGAKWSPSLFGGVTKTPPGAAASLDLSNLNGSGAGGVAKAEQKRTEARALADYQAALRAEGVRPGSGYRTQAQQDALRRRLGSDAARFSRHTTYQAQDVPLSATDEQLERAAARAGLQGFAIKRKPAARGGPHAHTSWSGYGESGDVGGMVEAEERASDKREEREKAFAEARKQAADALRGEVEQLAIAAQLTDMRANGEERLAETAEAMFELRRKHLPAIREIEKTDKETAKALLEQLGTAEKLTAEKIKQGHAAEDQRVWEQSLDDHFKKQADYEKQAVEEARRLQEEQADRMRESTADLADFFENAMSGGSGNIWKSFKEQGKRAIADMAAQWVMSLVSGQQQMGGGILGQINGGGGAAGGLLGMVGSLFGGGKGDPLGASINGIAASNMGSLGGSIGTAASAAPGGGIGGGLGGASGAMGGLGQAAGAFGMAVMANQMIGDIFGFKGGPLGVLTGLFKSTKKGSASLGFDGYGGLGVTSTSGNSGSRKAAASDSIGSIGDALSRIAEAVGGTLGGSPSVSIGVRKDSYKVDPTGQGRTKGAGVLDFGKDQEAAIRAAISEALRDGVVQGISDASKRTLQSGQDLQKAIEKAALIEDIPRQLKARLDPVGGAIDDLNKKWERTIAALKEGAASTEQMADAHKLYKLELEDANTAAGEASESLKAFRDSMNFGSASPFSLRDQEAKAMAALQPYLDKIDAGQSIDQAKYQDAARAYLDVERQLNGSGSAYFAAFDKIQGATGRAIATIDNAVPIRTASDPFIKATADSTAASAQILDMHSAQLASINSTLQSILGNMGGDGGFVGGGGRGFNQQQAM